MVNFQKGSHWARWDLHVHTPFSTLNNNFGNPDDELVWDEYISELFHKAFDLEIACIGITDYFSIKGYRKVSHILMNHERMEKIFEGNNQLVDYAKSVLLLPNIELGLNTFVGDCSVNYHVIFSEELEADEIETNFLERLTCSVDKVKDIGTEDVSLKEININKIGRKLKQEQGFPGTDYLVGLQNITVNHEDVSKQHNKDEFKSKHIIVLPCDEDLSRLDWAGRDHLTRKGIIKSCHAFFTSNPSTVEWALGKKSPTVESYIYEFGRLRPCLHGSDAHGYPELFNPDGQRYCWIKALPTFNGLFQILSEPKDRIRIQQEKPDYKDSYKLIDYVQIEDEKVQSDKIFLNENLNCLIGGRSTGKSLLLYNMATAIDQKQVVSKAEQTINSKLWNLNNVIVFWNDGAINSGDGLKKIIYIPQGHLNLLLNSGEQVTEIDTLIQSIICQDEKIKTMHDEFRHNLSSIDVQITKEISNLLGENTELSEIEDKYSEHGSVIDIQREIDNKKELLQKSENQTAEIENLIERLTVSKKAKGDLEQTLRLKEFDRQLLSESKIVVDRNSLEKIKSESVITKLMNFCDEFDILIESKFGILREELLATLSQEINEINEKIKESGNAITALDQEIASNQETSLLTSQINSLIDKKAQADLILKSIEEKRKEREQILDRIIGLISMFESNTDDFCNVINSTVTQTDDTKLLFSLQKSIREIAFSQAVKDNFDNRKLRGSSFNAILEAESSHSTSLMKSLIIEILEPKELSLKTSILKESAIKSITQNFVKVNYDVTMENDSIENMSPGKKSLVLLRLLIDLSESEWPILIDQPEDDLDNRSIFDDLVSYIKSKKKDRQIIIVTHNANIVVGGDAEQVIIANQGGASTPNMSRRFEYRSGGIESTEADSTSPGILFQFGIKDQICRILEGGEKAFELRSKKYFAY